ncbi:MAG: DNA polymerase III subunit gamma/tau [Planctomycetota bacterium]
MAKPESDLPAEDTERQGYTVLARRYRPQRFEDCVGQDHVVQALKNAIEGNRVAHAYLFTGSRGVGKTSMARIFAKSLNCVEGPTTQPCGKCDNCVSIASGDDVDVLEIDGASNRGIDEVRELRQGVHYRPSRSHFKIYIIDEVHMLTKEAFNALLKTLEEPPEHAKFLFATTEVQKIPITILSRCQRFDFAGIDMPKILGRMREIVASEGMSADEEALEIIARRAAGSMRDSQSLLDQVLAFGGNHITADDVHRVMGTAGEERVVDLARDILVGDSAAALTRVADAVAAGVQLGEWVDQTLAYFRDLLVLRVSPEADLVSMPNRMRDSMLRQTENETPERLLERMDLLAACRARMKLSTFGRTLLEMTLVRLCRLDQFLNLQSAITSPPPAVATAPGAANMVTTPAMPGQAKKKELSDFPANGAPEPPPSQLFAGSHAGGMSSASGSALATNQVSPPANVPAENALNLPAMALDGANLPSFWREAKKSIPDVMLASMLDTAVDVHLRSANQIEVRFPGVHAHSKSYCEDPARLAKIEEICGQLARRAVQVRFTLAADVAAPVFARQANPMELRQRAAKNPMVRKAEQILGAKIVNVDAAPTSPRETKEPKPDPE